MANINKKTVDYLFNKYLKRKGTLNWVRINGVVLNINKANKKNKKIIFKELMYE